MASDIRQRRVGGLVDELLANGFTRPSSDHYS